MVITQGIGIMILYRSLNDQELENGRELRLSLVWRKYHRKRDDEPPSYLFELRKLRNLKACQERSDFKKRCPVDEARVRIAMLFEPTTSLNKLIPSTSTSIVCANHITVPKTYMYIED